MDFELASDEKLCKLDYSNELACTLECTDHAQLLPDRLKKAVDPLGMCFAPAKFSAFARLDVSSSEFGTRERRSLC